MRIHGWNRVGSRYSLKNPIPRFGAHRPSRDCGCPPAWTPYPSNRQYDDSHASPIGNHERVGTNGRYSEDRYFGGTRFQRAIIISPFQSPMPEHGEMGQKESSRN